jgi:hypothetical protein
MSPILSIHPAASQPVTHGQNLGEPQACERAKAAYRLFIMITWNCNVDFFRADVQTSSV